MNTIQEKILKFIFKEIFKQGSQHNFKKVYVLINEAYKAEYTEDNNTTAIDFLSECQECANKQIFTLD